MGSLGIFLFVYFLGGLTFIPLVLSLILLHAYLTLPSPPPVEQRCELAKDPLRRPGDDQYSLKSGTDELAEKFHRTHESDVAAGYFAVCREYVPGGVNGKPPERTTPAGEVIAAESPSVYQTMYRSLFDRKQTPTIEPTKNNGKSGKKARNVFYIVLRHGHLMLYDDANQVEVRYVISLAHHDVNICGGEGEIQEGELWLKRNAICLSRRLESLADLGGPSPPFFLFSENLSEKEDFYFAMLQNQSRMWNSPDAPPKHQPFDVKHIVTLVQRLHSSEEQLQTRWINAVLGRLFLAMYRTPEMEEFVRKKITKKISRVNKPNFISKIGLQRIDMGEGAPFIINPRLKDLTVDGNCCVETDVQYNGNFRVEISATVRIDLGPRFKAREVDIVLAVVLKKLHGHLLIRFKPPPSNRAWISFETMPSMDMDIQPIVSSKQITYGIILRTIESRIREVVAESVVQPFWDDIPFLDTATQRFRGGIWQRDIPTPDTKVDIPDESGAQPPTTGAEKVDLVDVLKTKDERTMSAPVLSESIPITMKPRKGSKGELERNNSSASYAAIEKFGSSPPRAIRSQTFSNAADPVLTADNAKIDKVVYDGKDAEKSSAASAMIEISNRSPPGSPNRSPSGSPPTDSHMPQDNASQSRDPSIVESIESVGEFSTDSSVHPSTVHKTSSSSLRSMAASSTASPSGNKPRRSTLEALARSVTSSTTAEKSQVSLSLGTATSVAKRWGWNMFSKGEQNATHESPRPAGTPEEPIGRGHPLPPPGTPLPRPESFVFKRNSVPVTKRKPVPHNASAEQQPKGDGKRRVSKPPLPRRNPIFDSGDSENHPDELLVVEAPYDSGPNSPVVDVAPDNALPGPSTQRDSPTSKVIMRRSNELWEKANGHDRSSLVEDTEADKHGMAILSATDGIIP
ncbi:hypothetical protein F9C07_2074497 [Aspergillus flavus]|uniref:SMP-LTD domain-containing protein n=4 Tax=Aspergillus subgen. Circumdati TaxID=2720871 RepID=A0A7U2N2L6_ASPFN|nr:unnamed protein product [Aspergillus oryzae RIB40]XP_041149035.1 uncharacterized protein G4B84_009498 [Aspergillus flavus NRRL3357]KAB8240287.1 hypothetical protein BDV35DRAFT_398768 [Aspergillus flavus]KAJ1709975.1 hypothetical protein NYO67_7859 [Aspergillus flavus]QMW34032.1 hypothetical protein G4B84_009498 [Aspergillus flavus NRRL3357]QMW46087.1 hypothetical protein G4B11_009542 [Aspergillus flavus]QRD94230.1 hypothetical protein F9C07_2074497 [Aspergillus flavus]